ncbi:MAG: FAD-dependent oxidoreductase, partial [Clostridia bacterium]|nr:FAD-dependent oxidoreductase [Clostridia bacterium]
MKDKRYDAIVIGAGPAGIFTALALTDQKPDACVLIVDIGRKMQDRVCPMRSVGKCANCEPCAIVHGWAGAGAFSDGKLSLSPEVGGNIVNYIPENEARALIGEADATFLRFGAPNVVHGLNDPKVDELRYEASRYDIRLVPCPVRHLGTDRAGKVLGAMYDHLATNTRTEFCERTTAKDLLAEEGRIAGVTLQGESGDTWNALAPFVVAAPGRSGAVWLARQIHALGLKTQNNEVDIGVRVEVPNAVMDHLTKHLYEAKLVYYSDAYENKVRTFCMNPGGVVSEEHYDGGIAVVNGHSYADAARRTGNTNFAILVST